MVVVVKHLCLVNLLDHAALCRGRSNAIATRLLTPNRQQKPRNLAGGHGSAFLGWKHHRLKDEIPNLLSTLCILPFQGNKPNCMRFWLVFFFLALTCATAQAQGGDLRVYGGVNILQLSSDDGEVLIDGVTHTRTVSGRPGLQVGGAMTVGNRFYVQPGVQLSTLSTKIVLFDGQVDEGYFDETRLTVVSVPLKAGVRMFDASSRINVRIFGGLDGHHVRKVEHTGTSGVLDDVTVDDYSNLIINADFGMGADLLFGFVDMGYQIGLTPVHAGSDNATANSFYVNVGVKLSVGS